MTTRRSLLTRGHRAQAALLFTLVAAFSASIGRGNPSEPDHFKCYRVRTMGMGQRVALRGQFDEGFVEATLDSVVGYSNLVSKNGGVVHRKDAHLVWYRIKQAGGEPSRKVILKNQFGEQTWTIGSPVYLLVPAAELSAASQQGVPPDSVDHYKCYRVLSYEKAPGDPSGSLTLKDAWKTEAGVAAKVPRLFAVPVQKRHDTVTTTLWDGATHYAIYELSPRSPERRAIYARDQFGTRELAVRSSRALMVPSEKLSWGAVLNPVGVDTLTLSPMD